MCNSVCSSLAGAKVTGNWLLRQDLERWRIVGLLGRAGDTHGRDRLGDCDYAAVVSAMFPRSLNVVYRSYRIITYFCFERIFIRYERRT